MLSFLGRIIINSVTTLPLTGENEVTAPEFSLIFKESDTDTSPRAVQFLGIFEPLNFSNTG